MREVYKVENRETSLESNFGFLAGAWQNFGFPRCR